jgi:hypothetical protein
VSLGAPRPREAPNRVTPAGNTISASGPVSPESSSYEQLQQMLRERGVVWQQLKTVPGGRGEWLFTCAIPDPTAPGLQLHIEGQAADEQGLAAIRAALKEIDRKQRGDR